METSDETAMCGKVCVAASRRRVGAPTLHSCFYSQVSSRLFFVQTRPIREKTQHQRKQEITLTMVNTHLFLILNNDLPTTNSPRPRPPTKASTITTQLTASRSTSWYPIAELGTDYVLSWTCCWEFFLCVCVLLWCLLCVCCARVASVVSFQILSAECKSKAEEEESQANRDGRATLHQAQAGPAQVQQSVTIAGFEEGGVFVQRVARHEEPMYALVMDGVGSTRLLLGQCSESRYA